MGWVPSPAHLSRMLLTTWLSSSLCEEMGCPLDLVSSNLAARCWEGWKGYRCAMVVEMAAEN